MQQPDSLKIKQASFDFGHLLTKLKNTKKSWRFKKCFFQKEEHKKYREQLMINRKKDFQA